LRDANALSRLRVMSMKSIRCILFYFGHNRRVVYSYYSPIG
jgi:hypothetical protein